MGHGFNRTWIYRTWVGTLIRKSGWKSQKTKKKIKKEPRLQKIMSKKYETY